MTLVAAIGWAYTLDDVHVLKEYLLPAYYT